LKLWLVFVFAECDEEFSETLIDLHINLKGSFFDLVGIVYLV